MKFSITIETLIYPQRIRKVIGFGEADSTPDLLRKFIHQPDDLLQRLGSLCINIYFDVGDDLPGPEISSYEQLMDAIQNSKDEWCRQYGYREVPKR